MIDVFKDIQVENLSTSAKDVGGYFWARAGFVPNKNSWQGLKFEIERRITAIDDDRELIDAVRQALQSDNPKAIWLVADSLLGKKLLVKILWSGSLDMKDTDTMARLSAYTAQAKYADKAGNNGEGRRL